MYIPTPDTFDRQISIHAPHEGERLQRGMDAINANIEFQSTLPMRGSDRNASWVMHRDLCKFQSTLPMRGSDPPTYTVTVTKLEFQSTLPMRGSDLLVLLGLLIAAKISIHAPHEGERLCAYQAYRINRQISIHAPHEGERQRKSAFVCSISANLLNIIHCGAVTRAVSRRRIALFRLFSVRRSGVFMYAYASH